MYCGVGSLQETLKHVDAPRGHGVRAASGVGMSREQASRTEVIHLKDSTNAFNAMGIVTNNLARHRAGPNKPEQIAYRFDDDFHLVLKHLTAQKADYRIMSIHHGYEARVRADGLEIKQWRGEAALQDGIYFVIGHHAHVVRGAIAVSCAFWSKLLRKLPAPRVSCPARACHHGRNGHRRATRRRLGPPA